MKKTVSSVFCVAMACALLTAPASASAQSIEPEPDAPVLLTGKLTDAAGIGTPSKSPLTMYAWPSNEVLASLEVGETAKLVPIGRAETDEAGNFRFRASDVAAIARYSKNGEPVNVTVAGESATDDYWFGTSVAPALAEPAGTTELRSAALSGSSASPQHVEIKPASSNNSRPDLSQEYSDQGTYNEKFCGSTAVSNFAQVPIQVGGTFVHSSGASSEYQFTAGASSTLGVAASASGAYGSYTAGGTSTLSSSHTIDYPNNTSGAKFHQAYVLPKKFRTECYTPDGIRYSIWYEVRATAYTGGASTVTGTSFGTTSYCTPFGRGSTFTKNTSEAITWSHGFKLGSKVGVDVSSQSGFNTSSKVVFRAGTTNRRLCGHHDFPGMDPRSIKVSNS